MAKQKDMETVTVHTAESADEAWTDMGAGPQEGLSTAEGEKALDVVLDRLEAEDAVRDDGLNMDALADMVQDEFGGPEREDSEDVEDGAEGDGEDGAEGDGESEEGSDYTKKWSFTDAQLKLPVTLKVDGEEVEVSLGEALNGYQRQADYTRKTQELSEVRKEVKAARSQADELASAYSERLEALAAGLGRLLGPGQAQALVSEYQRAKQAQTAARAAALQDTLQEEHDALRTSLGWHDDEAVQDGYQALADGAAEEYGLAPKDLEGITDHRALIILHDALAYRKAKGDTKKALKENRRKTKTLKPGTRNVSDSDPSARKAKSASKLRKRVSETGNIHDAAEAIGAILGE